MQEADSAPRPLRPLNWLHAGERAVAALALSVAIASLTLQVVARYGFGAALSWPEELAKFCFVWAMFLGAAAGVDLRAHVAVELFVARLRPRIRALVTAAVSAGLVVLLVVLAWHGFDLVRLGMNSKLPAIDLPLGYLFLAGSVSLSLMAVSYAAQMAAALRVVRNPGLAGPTGQADPTSLVG